MKIHSLAIASLFVLAIASSSATTITENFSTDPLQNGWKIFGDTNSFIWNSASNNLAVTWDSRRTNSYFYHPLGTILTRDDDFSIEFDLNLSDIASGIEPFKTGPLQIALGFVKFSVVSDSSFGRGIYGYAPNFAEFDYYPDGYYTFGDFVYPSDAAAVPSFISGVNSYDYCPGYIAPFDVILPTNQSVRVTMTYTASNQTATLTLTNSGIALASLPPLVLNQANGFATNDNFFADTFSISSYSSFGDDYDSVLAHGTVGNLVVTVPPPPVQNLAVNFSGGQWQVQFTGQDKWHYVLQHSTNLTAWAEINSFNSTNANVVMTLTDTNSPGSNAFYRVRADRP
jgi:hypothetical protein